jgi:hypothetical protein
MLTLPAAAADIPSEVTLFKNVNIFDDKSDKLIAKLRLKPTSR